MLNATATDLNPDCDEFGENLAYSWIDENGATLGDLLRTYLTSQFWPI
jgi:hypothetical protein